MQTGRFTLNPLTHEEPIAIRTRMQSDPSIVIRVVRLAVVLSACLFYTCIGRSISHFTASAITTYNLSNDDLERIRDFVAEIDRTVPTIIQPVTPAWKIKLPPTVSQLLLWQTMFAEKLEQVRIIPQCHVALGDH